MIGTGRHQRVLLLRKLEATLISYGHATPAVVPTPDLPAVPWTAHRSLLKLTGSLSSGALIWLGCSVMLRCGRWTGKLQWVAAQDNFLRFLRMSASLGPSSRSIIVRGFWLEYQRQKGSDFWSHCLQLKRAMDKERLLWETQLIEQFGAYQKLQLYSLNIFLRVFCLNFIPSGRMDFFILNVSSFSTRFNQQSKHFPQNKSRTRWLTGEIY